MASLFHRSRQRRAERAPLTAGGNLNLVPLIDVLTSIVFFSLLTYTGAAMAMLTSYDLLLPPTVITAESEPPKTGQEVLNLLLLVGRRAARRRGTGTPSTRTRSTRTRSAATIH